MTSYVGNGTLLKSRKRSRAVVQGAPPAYVPEDMKGRKNSLSETDKG